MPQGLPFTFTSAGSRVAEIKEDCGCGCGVRNRSVQRFFIDRRATENLMPARAAPANTGEIKLRFRRPGPVRVETDRRKPAQLGQCRNRLVPTLRSG